MAELGNVSIPGSVTIKVGDVELTHEFAIPVPAEAKVTKAAEVSVSVDADQLRKSAHDLAEWAKTFPC